MGAINLKKGDDIDPRPDQVDDYALSMRYYIVDGMEFMTVSKWSKNGLAITTTNLTLEALKIEKLKRELYPRHDPDYED